MTARPARHWAHWLPPAPRVVESVPVYLDDPSHAAHDEIDHEHLSRHKAAQSRHFDLVDAAERLITDSVLRREMGMAARERAVARYDVQVCADTHLRAYRLAAARADR